jgi:hypothetical protein
MKWDDRSDWDLDFLTEVKKLTALRCNEDALVNGGLRWVAAENGYIAYLRESNKSSILVLIVAKSGKVEIDLSEYGYEVKKTLFGQVAQGNQIKFNSKSATQAIWRLK